MIWQSAKKFAPCLFWSGKEEYRLNNRTINGWATGGCRWLLDVLFEHEQKQSKNGSGHILHERMRGKIKEGEDVNGMVWQFYDVI